jgi:hypothetical protein
MKTQTRNEYNFQLPARLKTRTENKTVENLETTLTNKKHKKSNFAK